MKEANILKLLQIEAAKQNIRLFRNNTGMAWQSNKSWAEVPNKRVLIDARPVKFGLCEGSSDLIGFTPKIIRQEDVGRVLAVFTAIEVKSKTGKAKASQVAFLKAVMRAGGIAGIADSPELLNLIIEKHLTKNT